jgi:hypothetical protein
MDKVKERLYDALLLEDPGLVGCQRRQQWVTDKIPWRWVRGNAVLEVMATKKPFYTFAGPQEEYFLHDFLCMYRGGPWNTHWVEDFYDTWALAKEADEYEALRNTILVFHEDKGHLDIKQLPAPSDWPERLARMEQNYMKDPRGRISKATSYALKVCRFCPVKTRCDAHDKLKGEDNDWSPNYPTP